MIHKIKAIFNKDCVDSFDKFYDYFENFMNKSYKIKKTALIRN